jgi:hypothetical protein
MYDIYEATNVDEIFVDGHARIITGPATTKVECFRSSGGVTEESGETIEEREVFLRLVYSTGALLEASALLIKGLAGAYPQFEEASSRQKASLIDILRTIGEIKL